MTEVLTVLPRPRDVTSEFGIYVHVPFCSHRCWYCDFNAYAGLDHYAEEYMAALVRDAGSALSAPEEADLADRPPVTSVFIGGGTPSLVDAAWIGRLLDAIRDGWTVAPGAEITIECNPESIDEHKLAMYLDSGVNRISFGVQSLNDDLLGRLGRLHDADRARWALRLARASGFDDVNADLIFGIPGEDDGSWRASVAGVLACEPTHLSCYALTYEEGTPLESWRKIGRIVPVPDDDVARRWEIANEELATAGFDRYEISNWSLPGFPARHNWLYWSCGEYLGIGAGAHSHLAAEEGSQRSWVVKPPDRYARDVSGGRHPVAGSEGIGAREREAEVMFCGLRRTRGVDADHFKMLTGGDLAGTYGDELAGLAAQGLVTWDGTCVRLTEKGTLLANEVLVRLL